MSYRILPDNESKNSPSTSGIYRDRSGRVVPRGENHPCWRGGKSTSIYGYTLVKKYDHHFAMNGYVFEHRLIWEQHHKASLLPWADCHHINGLKKDNRIENLQAMMHGQHSTLTNKRKFDRRECYCCCKPHLRWNKHISKYGTLCIRCENRLYP